MTVSAYSPLFAPPSALLHTVCMSCTVLSIVYHGINICFLWSGCLLFVMSSFRTRISLSLSLFVSVSVSVSVSLAATVVNSCVPCLVLVLVLHIVVQYCCTAVHSLDVAAQLRPTSLCCSSYLSLFYLFYLGCQINVFHDSHDLFFSPPPPPPKKRHQTRHCSSELPLTHLRGHTTKIQRQEEQGWTDVVRVDPDSIEIALPTDSNATLADTDLLDFQVRI